MLRSWAALVMKDVSMDGTESHGGHSGQLPLTLTSDSDSEASSWVSERPFSSCDEQSKRNGVKCDDVAKNKLFASKSPQNSLKKAVPHVGWPKQQQ
jgi:hypothetical protein